MSNTPSIRSSNARPLMGTVDRYKVARDILNQSAADVAPIVMPALDMWPDRGVALNQVSVPAGTTTNSLNLQFPTDGFAVSIAATTEDGLAASMAGVLLRIQIDGRDDLWSSGTGNGAAFKPFSQISGQFSVGVFRFRRMFLQANAWSIFVQNTTAVNVVCDIVLGIVDTRNPPP